MQLPTQSEAKSLSFSTHGLVILHRRWRIFNLRNKGNKLLKSIALFYEVLIVFNVFIRMRSMHASTLQKIVIFIIPNLHNRRVEACFDR